MATLRFEVDACCKCPFCKFDNYGDIICTAQDPNNYQADNKKISQYEMYQVQDWCPIKVEE